MKRYRWLIIGLIVIFIFFVFSPRAIINPIKDLFFQISRPFSIVGDRSLSRLTKFFSNLAHIASITRQNEDLIKENLDLQSQLSVLKEAQHENEILKQELGFSQAQKNLNLLPANIIGRSMTGFLSTIIIDQGKQSGVSQGQAIISQGHLVGTVKEVYDHTSEINLITNYNSLVPVVLQDSRGTGLLRGGLKGLSVENIPLNILIKSGERLVTSGLGGGIPQGILVGQITEVTSKEGEIFEKASVYSPIQIYYLEFVFVVKG